MTIDPPGGAPGRGPVEDDSPDDFSRSDRKSILKMDRKPAENPGKSGAWHGTLTIEVPGGELVEVSTTFDSGSDTDAVSEEVAVKLKQKGIAWGDAGGGVVMADSTVAIPFGELRLLLTAEPKKDRSTPAREGNNELAIPRTLTFVTDAVIMKNLSSDLIIGWPTLKGTGLLAIALGLEEYEPEQDHDDDGLDDMWDDSPDPTYGMPVIKGTYEEVAKLRELCQNWGHLFGPAPPGGSKLPPIDIKLKKNPDGSDMRPKRQQARSVSHWI